MRRTPITALVAASALAASGVAVASVGVDSRPERGLAGRSEPERLPPPCHVVSTGDTGTRAAAKLVVGRLVRVRTLPEGAHAAERNPAADPSRLDDFASRPTDYVHCLEASRYFRFGGTTVARLLSAVRAPRGMRLESVGLVNGPKGTVAGIDGLALLTPPAGVVAAGIAVAASDARGGGVAVRVDDWAVWPVSRPPWEKLSTGIAAIRVLVRTSIRARSRLLTTLTSARDIHAAVRILNGLGIEQPQSTAPCPPGSAPFFELRFYGPGDRRRVASATEDGCGLADLRFTLGRRTGPKLLDATGGVTSTLSLLWKLRVVPVCNGAALSGTASDFFAARRFATAAIMIRDTGGEICAFDAIAAARLSSTTGALAIPAHPSEGTVTAIAPGDPALVLLNWHRTGDNCSATAASQLELTFRGARTPVAVSLGSLLPPVVPCGQSVTITGPESAAPLSGGG